MMDAAALGVDQHLYRLVPGNVPGAQHMASDLGCTGHLASDPTKRDGSWECIGQVVAGQ